MIARAILVLCLASAALAAGPVGWGGDINQGEGPKLIEGVRADLVAIVKADEADRAALIGAFVEARGLKDIEAVKRFRNRELRPLFLALLAHEDWRVRHRALYALEYCGKPGDVRRAWALASHENARMREKAVISTLKLWNPAVSKSAVQDRLAEETGCTRSSCGRTRTG
jgi:hypothetical protein